MAARVYLVEDGFAIRGIAPPSLRGQSDQVKLMFYGWALEAALKQKDRDLAQGLDKDGKPLRRISAATRKHRHSEMTPSGKGDPSAPPLEPGRKLSRVRSLLTGRAEIDHIELWWKFDPFTGDSFARVLEHQKDQGRDVFGLSPAALKRVMGQSWEKYKRWEAGKPVAMPVPIGYAQAQPIIMAGAPIGPYATMGIGRATAPTGQFSGGMRVEDWIRHLRQPAPVTIPGRPAGPYNRLLGHIWGGQAPPVAPPKLKPKPKPKPKPPTPLEPPTPPPAPPPAPTKPAGRYQFANHDEVEAWGKMAFPNAKLGDIDKMPLESWDLIADELHSLLKEWPRDIRDRIENFGCDWKDWTENPDSPAFAAASVRWGNIIAFNPAKWQSLEKLGAKLKECEASEWLGKGSSDPRCTVRHEFGHLVDGHLWREEDPRHAKLYDIFGVDPEQVNAKGEIKPGGNPMNAATARSVSQYATTDIFEAFAETFATMNSVPESEWSETVRKFAEIIRQ